MDCASAVDMDGLSRILLGRGACLSSACVASLDCASACDFAGLRPVWSVDALSDARLSELDNVNLNGFGSEGSSLI